MCPQEASVLNFTEAVQKGSVPTTFTRIYCYNIKSVCFFFALHVYLWANQDLGAALRCSKVVLPEPSTPGGVPWSPWNLEGYKPSYHLPQASSLPGDTLHIPDIPYQASLHQSSEPSNRTTSTFTDHWWPSSCHSLRHSGCLQRFPVHGELGGLWPRVAFLDPGSSWTNFC